MTRLKWGSAFAVPVALAAATISLSAQRVAAPAGAQAVIRVTKVRPNVFMLTGAGGNITLMPFAEGAVVVDTGTAAMADRVLATIGELSPKPIADIINTSATADHIGGNEKFHNAGIRLPFEIVTGEGPMVIAHENVMARMSAPTGKVAAAPEKAWPNETYHVDYKKLAAHYRGGEQIELLFTPAAHSDGDSIVWFRHADVISTGDVFMEDTYPSIETDNGGTINGELAALNKILDIAFADFRSENGTMIIPGHGRLCDMSDVGYYRDMLTIIRDRVQDMIKKGMTLDQVKAAKPTRDYDGRYGATTEPWTTDMFVEAVYKTLSPKKMKGSAAGLVVGIVALTVALSAQPQRGAPPAGRGGAPGRGAPATPQTPKLQAPIDLTGYWVSVITEDWRYRMVAAARGQHPGLPLSAEGTRVANTWDPAKDEAAGEQCKAYGAAGVMRMPGRIHITWDSDTVLKLETEAGTQTRLLTFGSAPTAGAGTWQGVSAASWETARTARRGGPAAGGDLKVVTTNMKPGYLQRNGVVYGEKATQTEYFNRTTEPNGDVWLTVVRIVADPQYLNGELVQSIEFKKLPDTAAAQWSPAPCSP